MLSGCNYIENFGIVGGCQRAGRILISFILIFLLFLIVHCLVVSILKSKTLALQAELPKSGKNFVKETLECGRRLARNKVN